MTRTYNHDKCPEGHCSCDWKRARREYSKLKKQERKRILEDVRNEKGK